MVVYRRWSLLGFPAAAVAALLISTALHLAAGIQMITLLLAMAGVFPARRRRVLPRDDLRLGPRRPDRARNDQ